MGCSRLHRLLTQLYMLLSFLLDKQRITSLLNSNIRIRSHSTLTREKMKILQQMTQQHQRIRRQLIKVSFGSNERVVHPPVIKTKGNQNQNNISIWPDKTDPESDSNGLKIMNSFLKDGSDLIGAPSRLINKIQEYWLISLVCITIILVCILLLYCIIRAQCASQRKGIAKLIPCISKRSSTLRSTNEKQRLKPIFESWV